MFTMMVQPWVPIVHHSRCTKEEYELWGSATQGGQRRMWVMRFSHSRWTKKKMSYEVQPLKGGQRRRWVMRFSHSRCTKKNMSYEVQPASDRKKVPLERGFFGNPSHGPFQRQFKKKDYLIFFKLMYFILFLIKNFFFPINFHNNYFSPFLITTSNFIIISLFFPIHPKFI